MNILMLTDLFLPHSGGSRVYYYNLYKHLVSDFPDSVTILTKKVAGWEEFDARVSTPSLKIIRRFKPLCTWKYHELPKALFPLVESIALIRKQQVDVLHCGDLYPPGAIGLMLRRLGMPYIMFSHGDEISQIERRRYQPLLRDRIYCGADAVIAANEYAYRQLQRIGVRGERVHKITPGVDCERFRPLPCNQEFVTRLRLQESIVLLSVGRLVPKKGYPTVLRAVAQVALEIPRLRYLIVGDGAERPRLEQMARDLGLGNIVTFLGDVPQERLPEFYNLCDVFVLGNREVEGDIETFGMVFLEASAVGKPVIAGRSGGTVEAVVDGITGLLADPENDDEFAAALHLLVRNRTLRAQMGAAGSNRVRTQFEWCTRATMLRDISREVVNSRRSRKGSTSVASSC